LVFELTGAAGTPIQLLPAGSFQAEDGRPLDSGTWKLTAALAAKVIAFADASKNRLVIDYEHQTINAESNGQPAPAAGWFKQMAWREGEGLFALDVEWTDKAKAMIAAKEYRYLSPVFSYNPKSGEVQRILHVALVNTPALDGMQEVALKKLSGNQQPDEDSMNPTLKLLLAALGLPETTTEASALLSVTALKTASEQIVAKDAELATLKAKADLVAAKDVEIAALKDAAVNQGNPDPAKFIPVSAVKPMQDQLAALTLQVQGREVDEVVTAALKEGRLFAAQETWARGLGASDLPALKEFVNSAPVLAALKGTQTGGELPAGGKQGDLSVEQVAICKALGFNEEEYKKSLA
ncbi:MAG: phage protease, partial [Undibacterium sp.]|nr:phage protease [Undibacterium sp.]